MRTPEPEGGTAGGARTAALRGKRVIVVGLGKSGIAAVRLCLAEGAEVVGNDARPEAELAAEVRALPIRLLAGRHDEAGLREADLIVVSPGVPRLPDLDAAERAGVEVIGELELAARRLRAPIVAVGGTNGKSTTTTLIGALLRAAGSDVFVGGNLGTPASAAVGGAWSSVVLEVSSFQLERAPTFRPRVALLLNVTDDHLDRYASFADYARAKGNAFVNQTEGDWAIVPAGDAECARQARRGHGRLLTFGLNGDYALVERSAEGGRREHGDPAAVVERRTGTRFELAGTRLFGRHNHENAAAALGAVRALGADAAALARALVEFVPLPHRMALVCAVRGVRFYDDSKATNVGAAVTALDGLSEERAVLIAGGRDKLGSYEPLARALEHKGRALVLLGEARARIAAAVGDRVPTVLVESMDAAVRTAFDLALSGDAVLLSPACSSFDMFESYADRGERFAAAALALARTLGEEAPCA